MKRIVIAKPMPGLVRMLWAVAISLADVSSD